MFWPKVSGFVTVWALLLMLTTGTASAAYRGYSAAYWSPTGTDVNTGGEYQADVPQRTVNCTVNPTPEGMLVKTMWLYNGGTYDRWVEFGWFAGLGADQVCYSSSFYMGWVTDEGNYAEYRSQSGGNTTTGSWNTFRLRYIGLNQGYPYYQGAINGNVFLTVRNGTPSQTKLDVGFETDLATTCIDATTYVKEWKRYNYGNNTWAYPSSATLHNSGAWIAQPVWTTPFHDMKWNADCGGV